MLHSICQHIWKTQQWPQDWKRSVFSLTMKEGLATHSSILAWRTPWREERGGLQSMDSHRVRHDWMTKHNMRKLSEDLFRASLVAQLVKNLPAMWEIWVWSLGWEDPLEKEMATHYSTLAWKIPWTEEPGRLQSMGSQRVGHDWATSLSLFIFMHWRRKWQPTPVFLPGESQGRGSLVGCRLWGRTDSDTTEAT